MSAPWKFLSGSAAGTSHERGGEPCQDYAHGRLLTAGGSPGIILVCADGAGSAARAEVGAKLACLTYLRTASAALECGLRIPDITGRHVLSWHQQTRQRLSLEASVCNMDIRDFACTLLTAIICDDGAIFSQIGDGVIIVCDASGYQYVFWPQSGEYVNETFFLTGPDFQEHLEVRRFPKGIDELALLTDGLQPLALHYASRSVHGPFFDPMFQSLRKAMHPEDLEVALIQWLQSKAVNDLTDDDKTLVLATRRSATNGNS